MNNEERKVWFPAKRYGWGWGPPTCWQGWVVIIVFYLLLGGSLFLFMRNKPHPALFVISTLILSSLLIGVCYLKGEKPRWRWGRD